MQSRRAEPVEQRRGPVELREPAARVRLQGVPREELADIAAARLVARDELAAADVVLDVGVVVERHAVGRPLPHAREHRERAPLPAALNVDPVPATRLGGLAAVRLMREPEIEKLEAVAFVAVAEAEDRLGLVVGLSQQTGVARVVDLPVHALRIAEPKPDAVDPRRAKKRRDADALESLARGELGLEAHLQLELVAVEVLARQRLAAGRWARGLCVRVARPARKDVGRAISDDIGEAARPGLLAAELPRLAEVRRRGRQIDRAAGRRLGRPRHFVVAGEASVAILELRAALERFVRGALRTPERRTEQREYAGRGPGHWPNLSSGAVGSVRC